MNPQYPSGNPGGHMPPTGYGPPPGALGNRPPGPGPAMFNGVGQPPTALSMHPPQKVTGPGPNQFSGPPRQQNGPPGGFPSPAGPHGDQRGQNPNMQRPPGMTPQYGGSAGGPTRTGPGAPPHSTMQGHRPPVSNGVSNFPVSSSQLSTQMGSMSLSGGPPRSNMPGAPPSNFGHPSPPLSQAGQSSMSGAHPSNTSQRFPPPHGAAGPPTSGAMPPKGFPPGPGMPHPPQTASTAGSQMQPSLSPNSSQSGMMPPSSASAGSFPPPSGALHSGFPPTSSHGPQGFPPSSHGPQGFPPPSSTHGPQGFPPSSTHGPQGFPPSSTHGPQGFPPPSSTHGPQGFPPASSHGPQGFPPSSTHGPQGFPPLSSSSHSQGFPPSSQGGFASSAPGGFPPPSSTPSGFPPTSSIGGQQHFNQLGAPPGPNAGPQGGMPPGQPPPPGQQYIGGSMPGQGFPQQNYPGAQRMPGPGAMQQPGPKKLDPDQMPSPIQVTEDDESSRGGVFSTADRGCVPPLVTTNFMVQDLGNSSPRFIRGTMYNVPCTSDMLKNSNLPFALSITPFAQIKEQENPPPIVNLGEIGPVRCKRCKAYMNPNMLFIDGGRRFQCVFCGAQTDVPPEYFQHLDHTGRRVDCYERPELCLGSYEFVATKDYCKNGVLPKPPAFIFMIDVSYNSIKSGLVNLICENLKNDILSYLPKDIGAEESEVRVGFVTYSKEIHFYNVKGNLAQPQMLVVSDLQDMFVPLLDGFLVKASESYAVIDSLLAQIPEMFAESRETETILGPVIQAGLDALQCSDRSGKLFIFHTSLPIAEAPGKLKNREDRKLLGTDKEKNVLTAQDKFYGKLAQDCVGAGCSVDLFLFPNAYIDLATISDVCRMTGGNIYKYSYFQPPKGEEADLDGDRFMEDLKRSVESQVAFDAILRVRTSTGIRPVDFFGNFYMSNTTDVEMASVDTGSTLNVDIKHDDKLNEGDGAFVQVAVLYTSVGGQRRLRIHNLALNCCSQMADLFRNCELDTLMNYLSKQSIRLTLNSSPRDVREKLTNQCANILACYRKNCASPSSAGQLILPECMKLLPLYINCLLKNDGLQGGSEISTDDRSYLMHLINAMTVAASHVFFYPRLLPLHNLDLDSDKMPRSVRCSVDRLQDNGVYLLENGISMFMWIGFNVDPHWIQEVFGVQSAAQVDIDKCQLLTLDNKLSKRINDIILEVRQDRNRFMKLTIVRQRDKLESWFQHFLVEDKGLNGSSSYVDFLCHIHKEIRNLLS